MFSHEIVFFNIIKTLILIRKVSCNDQIHIHIITDVIKNIRLFVNKHFNHLHKLSHLVFLSSKHNIYIYI